MRIKRPLFLASAVILPLLIGASYPQLVDGLRTFTISLVHPVLDIQNRISSVAKTEFQAVLDWPKLRRENEILQGELEQSRAQLIGYEELKKRSARLEALLRLKENGRKQAVVARVIALDPSQWSQFIVINKGVRDGVRKNTVLIHPDGLVGKVAATGPRASRAILLMDRQSRASAMNQRTRDVGLIEGTGTLILKMTYLDRQADLQIGDVVVTSGFGGIYPKGIPIGTVETVGQEKDRLGIYALVRPYVTFSKLEEVLCVPSLTGD